VEKSIKNIIETMSEITTAENVFVDWIVTADSC
jgi:hypothetical protein